MPLYTPLRKEHKQFALSLLSYPNVIGYSNITHPKVKGQAILNVESIRVYVRKKLPLTQLNKNHVLPTKGPDGLLVDVIELGDVTAPRPVAEATTPSKTGVVRPLVSGISCGNEAITAGTFDFVFKDNKGNLYGASNAHVFTPSADMTPDEVKQSGHVHIYQPGPYDGGTVVNTIGIYYWHQRVVPYLGGSNCPIGNGMSNLYNVFAKVLNRKTRLFAQDTSVNNIDFALCTLSVDWEPQAIDYDVTGKQFVGLLFAGGQNNTIICKGSYIAALGYAPVNLPLVSQYAVGLPLEKSGRTTCHTTGTISDPSASVIVSYETFEALYDDVIVSQDLASAGGDSGSLITTP
jgi:hypothetical protein